MNKLKKNALKCIKLSLATFMLFTSVDMKVFAEDTEVVSETQTDEVEVLEETDVQNTTETVVEETVVETEEPIVEETVEEVVEEQVEEEPQVDLSVLDDTDFTSGRLLVSEEALPEEAPVIGVLDGMALVQYETEESAKIAYLELSESANVVVDTNDFGVAEDTEVEETPIEAPLTEESNPFAEVEKTEVEDVKYDIAIIDTGATEADGIVSVLGDDGIDYHGHGQNMINTIKGINPSAKVLSIKALDNTGVGGTSAIYAAIRIAIDNKVKIINLSISATKTEDNKVIEDIINEAVEKGIKVVGAAGNNNIDAVNTIPGGVESAIVIGASDDEGNKQPNSNFGDSVDYLMPAKSTSYASAKASAYLSLDRDLAEVVKEEKVDGIAYTEEQEANEDFETQGDDSSGSGYDTGDSSNYAIGMDGQVAAVEYVWWDTEDRAGNDKTHTKAGDSYSKAEMTDANIEAEREFWIQKLTNKIGLQSDRIGQVAGYARPSNFPYKHVEEYYDSMNTFDNAIRNALNDAFNRVGKPANRVRVVSVGVTFQKYVDGSLWFLAPPWEANGVPTNGYNGSHVIRQPATTTEVPEKWFNGDIDPALLNRPPKANEDNYAKWIHGMFKDNNTTMLNSGLTSAVYVIAVADDFPSDGGGYVNVTKSGIYGPVANTGFVVYIDNNNDSFPNSGDTIISHQATGSDGKINVELSEEHIGKTITVREHTSAPGYVKPQNEQKKAFTQEMWDNKETIPFNFNDYQIYFRKKFKNSTPTEAEKSQFEFRVYAGDVSANPPKQGDANYDNRTRLNGTSQANGTLVDVWTGVGDHAIGSLSISDTTGDYGQRLIEGQTYTIVETKAPSRFKKMEPIVFKAVNNDNLIVSNQSTSGNGWVWNSDNKIRMIVGTNEEDTLDLTINKKVKNTFTEYVKNNPNYDLAGTEFTVYYDEARKDKAKDINGNDVVLKVKKNSDGTYSTDTVKVKRNGKTKLYLLETKTGKGYKEPKNKGKDNPQFEVDIANKSSATATIDNEPLKDPVTLIIDKVGNGITDENVLPLSGAVFEMRYYPLDVSNGKRYTKADLANKTPAKTFTGTTKKLTADDVTNTGLVGKYGINFNKILQNANVFGDGTTNVPLGVYAIEEITPAPGYLKSNTKFKDDNIVLVDSDNTIIVHSMEANNTFTTIVNYAGKDVSVSWQDVWEQYEPSEMTGSFDFTKVDKDFKEARPQGDGSLKSATFELINKNDYKIFYADKGVTDYTKRKTVEPGKVVMTLTVDEHGKCDKLPITISPGKYELVETEESEGYLKADKYSFEVKATQDNQDNEVIKFDMEEPIKEGSASITKRDTDTKTNKPQGDASLANIQYAVVNRSKNPVMVNNKEQAVGNVVVIASTNEQGKVVVNDLSYGTYDVIELSLNHTVKVGSAYNDNQNGKSIYANERGMLYTKATKQVVVREDGKTYEVEFTNPITRGGIDVQKINEELKKAQNEGDSSLEGNKFNIVNASLHDVFVEGKWYKPVTDKNANKTNWTENSFARVNNITREELVNAKNNVSGNGAVVKTLTTDKEGFAKTDLDTLPYGTYYMYEAETNSSMLLDTDWVLRIEVRENEALITTVSKPAENPIVRGDLYFTKVNEDGVRRPNTPFLIAALDQDGKIIESHVIVTDSSGIASTAFTYTTVEEDNMLETTQAERKHSSNTNGFDKYVKKNADGSYSVTEEGEALLASGEASTYGVWFSQGLDVNTGKIVKNSKADVDDTRGALYYGTFQIFEVQCKENKDLGEDLLISKPFRIKNKNQVYNANGDLMSESDKNVRENELKYADAFVDLEVLLDTRARDVITDTQTTFADREVVLSDTIAFSNIKSTSTYKWEIDFVETETGNVLSTVVVDKFKPEATNNAVNTTNQPKMAFTVKTDGTISPATNIDGTVNKGYQGTPEVTTTGNVDTTGLGGKSISVVVELYEYITGYDFDSEEDYKEFEAINFITSHNTDRKDENEKIYIPKIETVAQDKFTKDHVGTKHKEDSIKDTVKLTNISPKEKYQLVAYVWDLDEDKLFSDKKVVKDFYSDRANVSHIEDLTVEMPEFELDSSNFADKTLVVFEELWRVDDSGKPVDEYPVAVHTDKLDEDQSIHYIDIDTELTDEFTGDHVGTVTEKVTLTDKVDLKNLLKGMEYTIKGDLVYRADGTTKDGKSVKAGDPVPVLEGSQTEVKFTSEESGDHTVYITYVVDSRNLEGIDVVSTEEAYHNKVLIDRHYDLEDDDQTVNFPKVGTVAVDSKTNDNVGTVLEDGTIIDTVEVCNLVPGEDYTITGKLVLQEDGSELVDVVSEPYSFTATEEQEGCSFVEITFKNVDATKIVGKSVVAFEYLTHTSKKTNEPVEVAKHEDIEDDAQTVHFPDVRTEATDRRTGDKVGSIFGKLTNAIRKFFGQDVLAEDETEIVDKVVLTNLALDKTYTVKGKLMDQETGELLNGQEITAEDEIYVGKDGTLKAKNGSKVVVTNYDEKNHQVDGYIELVFKLGTDEITNKSVVVFEKLFHKNSKTGEDIEVNKHEDPNDEAQFVNLIEVDSVAVDSNTLTHMGDTPKSDLADTKIIETFNMRKLVNGQDYKVDFALVVREESAKQGKPIYLAEDGSFTDDRTKAMTKVVEFKALAEKEVSGWRVIVNGEELFVGETHDEAQAFYNEYLSKLTDEEKENAEVYLIEKFTEMQQDEEAFSAGATLEVEFDIKHETVAGYTLVVVADTYHNDTIVAIHNDIYNELESVHYPNIGTKAEITDTEKDVKARRVRVLDTVSYTNLTPGVEYTLVARGMSETGKAIVKANGDEYVFTKTFTPTKPNGKEAVEMLFDRDDIESYKLVAFEKLFINYGLDGELEVARHEDLEDENQTVVLYQKVKLTVNKKSADTKMPLKGAEITVFDSRNEVVLDKDNKEAVQLTDEKGQVEFEIYMYVNEQYYARETKAPEGYALNTDKFNIAIVDKRVEEVEINIEILDELLIIVPPTGVDGKLLIGAGVVLLATIIALGYVLVKKKDTDTHKH